MVVIEIPKDEKTEELLNSLTDHLNELKEEASDIRKQGIDTTIADVLMMDVLSKIKMARVTYDTKDVDSVKKSLAQIRHEIDVAKEGTDFDGALENIQRAYDYIRHDRCDEATQIYDDLRKLYPNLPGEERKIVYKAALDIHRRIVEHTGS